ncbi:hypothetical protein B566_EDAN009297 [Ephemera danica]|nr:hypothetical protein B566_EDAN009297 [Ephemera danica]
MASLDQLPPQFNETYAAILTLITNMLPFIETDNLLVEVFEFSLQTLNHYRENFCEYDTSVALAAINLCKKILRVREAPANVLLEDASNFGTILVKLCSHHAHANLSISEVNRGKLVCYLKSLIQTINCIMCEFTPNSAISETLIQNLLTISEKFGTTSIDVSCLQVFKTLQCHTQFEREIKAVFNYPKPDMCKRLARLLKSGKHEESLEVIELFTSLIHIREKVYEMLQEMSSSKPQINSGPTNLLLSQDHQKFLDHSLHKIQTSALAENVLLYMDKLIEKENRLQIMDAKLQESKKDIYEYEAQLKVIKKDLTKEHESRLQTERSIQLVRQDLLGEKERYQTLFATYSQLTEDMKHRLDQSKTLEEKLAVYEKEATALQHAKKKLEKQCELKDATIKNLEAEKEGLRDEIKQFNQLQDQITMLMKRKGKN